MSRLVKKITERNAIATIERLIRESTDDNTDAGWRSLWDRGDAPATYTGGMRGPRYARALPSLHDRDEGRFYPFYVEERDLEEMRAKARHLATFTSVALGALQATRVYTMGGEWEYKVIPREEAPEKPSPDLLKELNVIVKAILEKNAWVADLDCEIHDTSREDGESIVAGYEAPDGLTDLRRLDADNLRQPASVEPLNQWLGYDRDDSSWSFGVHTLYDPRQCRIDHERHIGLHVVFTDGGRDWDYLPTWPQRSGDDELDCKFGHLVKRNTPRRAKRGISDYWPVQTDIERFCKASENTAVGVAALASIPWFETVKKGVTRDQAQSSMARALDDFSRAVTQNRGGQNIVQVRKPGTIVKRPEGTEITLGPLGQMRQPVYIEVMQHLLRIIGLRWLMPEYMISGDASNANFASTLVSESPFVKAREADQKFYVAHFKQIIWKTIKIAFDHGRFRGLAQSFQQITETCELSIQAPMVASRDKANHLLELQQLWTAGLITGNEYRIDLKREPKPEYEEKTGEPKMLPPAITNGLAAMGSKGNEPGDDSNGGQNGPAGDPANPKAPEPKGGGSVQPKPAQAPAGQKKTESVAREDCGANAPGGGGFQAGNECAGDGDGEGEEPAGQKRAKAGGEIGPNGEHYKGGAFIATTDMPKKARDKRDRAAGEGVLVEPGKRAVPEPGKMSIWGAVGVFVNPRSMEINDQAVGHYGRDRKEIGGLVDKYQGGERFVPVEDHPNLANFNDAARMAKAGKTIPGELLGWLSKARGTTPEALATELGVKKYDKGDRKTEARDRQTETVVAAYGKAISEAATLDEARAMGRRIREDCGANAPGGGGFQPGNDCSGDGDGGAKLSAEESGAVEDYTGSAWQRINGDLRSGRGGDNSTIKAIDSAIAKATPLAADRTLFRGIPKGVNLTFKPGMEFTDKAFVSTSASQQTAEASAAGDGAVFRIKAPKGAKALAVGGISANPAEGEFLLPRGSRFKVTRISKGKHGVGAVIDAELLQ